MFYKAASIAASITCTCHRVWKYSDMLLMRLGPVKPVCNDHLYNKTFFICDLFSDVF